MTAPSPTADMALRHYGGESTFAAVRTNGSLPNVTLPQNNQFDKRRHRVCTVLRLPRLLGCLRLILLLFSAAR
jgi:hypothetical protein